MFPTFFGVSGAYPGSITEIKCEGLMLSQTVSKSFNEQTTIIIKLKRVVYTTLKFFIS